MFLCLIEDVRWGVGELGLNGFLDSVVNVDAVGSRGVEVFVKEFLDCLLELWEGGRQEGKEEKGGREEERGRVLCQSCPDQFETLIKGASGSRLTFRLLAAVCLNCSTSLQNRMFSLQCSFSSNCCRRDNDIEP